MSVLEIKNVTMRFGGLTAVDNFNLKLEKGDLAGIIGPNGAGKTTIFNIITGVYIPTEGQILLGDDDITNDRPSSITQKGIARTFQNIRLFKDLTVLENILIAQHYRRPYSFLDGIFRNRIYRDGEKDMVEKSMHFLKTFSLDNKANSLAKNLPYGKQRRLEMARALATNPNILLLDEPAAGMNPKETAELTDLLGNIRNDFEVSILLIEHDMKLVMNVCENISVVDHGVLISRGDPHDVQNDPKVIEAYLGTEDIHV